MMGSEKKNKRNKLTGNGMTCERTYVSERCSRAAAAAAACSTTADPGPRARCRHQRRGAVREKRPASLGKTRLDERRTDNEYVVTSYDAATDKVTFGGSGAGGRYSRITAGPPLIDITAIGEDVMMKPIRPPAYGAAIEDEFPAYVPWKALVNGGDGMPEPKCRCAACRRQHGAPSRLRVNATSSISSSASTAALSSSSSSSASSSSSPPPPPPPPAAQTGNGDRRRASRFKKWRICALLCACFPCLDAYRPLEQHPPPCPSDYCLGDVNVPHCECVDWDALTRDIGRIRGTTDCSGSDHRRRLNNYRRRNELLTFAATPPLLQTAAVDGETNV